MSKGQVSSWLTGTRWVVGVADSSPPFPRWPMGTMAPQGSQALQQDYARLGLIPNHAYSILDVRCLETEQPAVRLVRLRNPWGKCAWRGAWSDHDPAWRSRLQLKEQLQPCSGEQGIFWMEFKDFMWYVIMWYNIVS